MKLHNQQTQAKRQLHMGCGETLDPQMREWLRGRSQKPRAPREATPAQPARKPERAR